MGGADLRGANLSMANLRWANLTDANLRGADLTGADLTDAEVDDEQLASVKSLVGAKLPEEVKKVQSSQKDLQKPTSEEPPLETAVAAESSEGD